MRIKPIFLSLIGLLFFCLMGFLVYYLPVRKQMARLAELKGRNEAADRVTATAETVVKDYWQAKAERDDANQEWEHLRETRMPYLDFTDSYIGTFALWFEQREEVGPIIYDLVSQAGCVVDAIEIPAPSSDIFTPPGELITIPPAGGGGGPGGARTGGGTITISFTAPYENALKFLRSIQYAPRIVALTPRITMQRIGDGLVQVSGLTLTVYTYVRLPEGAPAAGGAAPGAPAGGGPPAKAAPPPR